MNIPKDKQYVWVKYLYMDKETEEPAQFLEKHNCFMVDFYSGNGYVDFKDVISWRERTPDGVAKHPWTAISDGAGHFC